jgi:sentrin-specific protease 1
MKERRIQMYDSMGGSGMHYLKSLFQYLQDEHMDKKGTPLPDKDQWELVGYQPGTPCQKNGFDCGVFTCMFADFLSRDWPLVFSQEHITQCRERIALSIMRGSAIL